MNETKFLEKLQKIKQHNGKFLLLIEYFSKANYDYLKFKDVLFALRKLSKNFNFLKRTTTNSIFANSLHLYMKEAIKSITDDLKENDNLYRSFNAEIKITDFLKFNVEEYVSVEKQLFNIDLYYYDTKINNLKDMFHILNAAEFAIKNNIFKNRSRKFNAKMRINKAMYRNLYTEMQNKIEKADEEIPF